MLSDIHFIFKKSFFFVHFDFIAVLEIFEKLSTLIIRLCHMLIIPTY